MRLINALSCTALAALAAIGLAASASAQTGSPVEPNTKAENTADAVSVAKAAAREARRTSAAKLLSERELGVEASDVSAGTYTVRVKRRGSGPTVLSGRDDPDSGSFSEFDEDLDLTSAGRTYLKALRKRSARSLGFEVSVTFRPADGGSTVKATERYTQRIRG